MTVPFKFASCNTASTSHLDDNFSYFDKIAQKNYASLDLAFADAALGNISLNSNVTIAGEIYNYYGKYFKDTSGKYYFNYLPSFAVVGASMGAHGSTSYGFSGTYTGTYSVPIVGSKSATFTFSISGQTTSVPNVSIGQRIYMGGASQSEFNGCFVVTGITSGTVQYDTITFTLAKPATVTTPTSVSANVFITMYAMQQVNDLNFWCVGEAIASAARGSKVMRYLGNYSVTGSTSAMHTTFVADALNPANNDYGLVPDFVMLDTGGNDVLSLATFTPAGVAALLATMKTNVTVLINMIIAAGSIPVVGSLPPFAHTAGSYNMAMRVLGEQFNQWLAYLANQNTIIFNNTNPSLTDQTSSYLDYVSTYSFDGIHPVKLGAYVMGKTTATNLFANIIGKDTRLGADISPNPQFLVTSGGTLSGATGAAVGGVTLTGGNTATVVGAVNGIANNGSGIGQNIAFTASATSDWVGLSAQLSGSVTAGDKIYFQVKIHQLDAAAVANLQAVVVAIFCTVNGIAQSISLPAISASINTLNNGDFPNPIDFLFETPLYVVPANTTSLQPFVRFIAAGIMTTANLVISNFVVKKWTGN